MLYAYRKESKETFSDVLKEIISNTNELCLVVEKENKNLEGGDAKDFNYFVEKKQQLLDSLYTLEKKVHNLVTPEGKKLHETLIERIKQNFKKMGILMSHNQILLNTHLEISTKLFELLKAKHVNNTVYKYGYGKEGKLSAIDKLERIIPALEFNSKV